MSAIKAYLPYVFLALGLIIFALMVVKDLVRAIYLKRKGIKAYGKLVGVNTLSGRDKWGKDHKSIQIQVNHGNTSFTFECLHTQVHADVFGKIPVVFIPRENAQPICDIDSWSILLTDAIIWMVVSSCLVAGYFLTK